MTGALNRLSQRMAEHGNNDVKPETTTGENGNSSEVKGESGQTGTSKTKPKKNASAAKKTSQPGGKTNNGAQKSSDKNGPKDTSPKKPNQKETSVKKTDKPGSKTITGGPNNNGKRSPKGTSPQKPKQSATEAKITGKHPGGRTNTRGQMGKDYKMINLAIPMDVYEGLKASCGGNMTYYINDILKNAIK